MTERTVSLGELVSDPTNARKHNPRNVAMIEDALREVGAARSIVIDEDNIVLAGNGVVDAAAAAGITNVRIIKASGNEIIAVQREGLTEEQKQRLALFDNRTGDLSTWDADVLEQLRSEAPELLDGMFYSDELEKELEGIRARERDFTPRLDPDTTAFRPVTDQQVASTAERIDTTFGGAKEYRPIVCPHCLGEFYLNAVEEK